MNTGKNLSLTTLQNTSDEVPRKGSHSKVLKTKSSLGGHCLIPERQRPLTQTRKNSKKLEKLWVVTQSLETQPFRSQRILKPCISSRNQNFKQKNSELRQKHAGNTLNPWGTPGLNVFTTLRIPLQKQRKSSCLQKNEVTS